MLQESDNVKQKWLASKKTVLLSHLFYFFFRPKRPSFDQWPSSHFDTQILDRKKYLLQSIRMLWYKSSSFFSSSTWSAEILVLLKHLYIKYFSISSILSRFHLIEKTMMNSLNVHIYNVGKNMLGCSIKQNLWTQDIHWKNNPKSKMTQTPPDNCNYMRLEPLKPLTTKL